MEINNITWQQTIPLRQQVLWPTKPPEFCQVDGDEQALHFGAYLDNKIACVASIYIDGDIARLRKFATGEPFQGRGIGSAMISHILVQLKNINTKIFWCDARESAMSFYQRFGMKPMGKRFYKAEVSYFKMQVTL